MDLKSTDLFLPPLWPLGYPVMTLPPTPEKLQFLRLLSMALSSFQTLY